MGLKPLPLNGIWPHALAIISEWHTLIGFIILVNFLMFPAMVAYEKLDSRGWFGPSIQMQVAHQHEVITETQVAMAKNIEAQTVIMERQALDSREIKQEFKVMRAYFQKTFGIISYFAYRQCKAENGENSITCAQLEQLGVSNGG